MTSQLKALILFFLCISSQIIQATDIPQQESNCHKMVNFIKTHPGKIAWSTILVLDAIAILAQPNNIKNRAYNFGMGMLPSDPPSTLPGIAGFITFCCIGATGIYYIAELRDIARKNRKNKQETAYYLALQKDLVEEILNQKS